MRTLISSFLALFLLGTAAPAHAYIITTDVMRVRSRDAHTYTRVYKPLQQSQTHTKMVNTVTVSDMCDHPDWPQWIACY